MSKGEEKDEQEKQWEELTLRTVSKKKKKSGGWSKCWEGDILVSAWVEQELLYDKGWDCVFSSSVV